MLHDAHVYDWRVWLYSLDTFFTPIGIDPDAQWDDDVGY